MTEDIQHNSGPRHAKQKQSHTKALLVVLCVIALLAACCAGLSYAYFSCLLPVKPTEDTTSGTVIAQEPQTRVISSDTAANAANTQAATPVFHDRSKTAAQEKADKEKAEAKAQAAAAEAAAKAGIPTPLIAEYDGVVIHTPIRAQDLEGILFHQAATEYGLPLSTQLAEADPDKMLENPDYEIAKEQPIGNEWLKAKALHLWRVDTPTSMDSSIDVGAEANTQVYAPVTGTVVLVRTYDLYDVVEDYEIHIQPEGRPDLDVVEIHVQDVSVKAGDKVTGGETPIAKVRDLAAEDITDIQLAFYSKEGHGNHTHIQVNNADAPKYRETRLKDAIKVA